MASALLIGLCAALSTPAPAAETASLRAGLVRGDITPSQPVTLSGYASRKDLSRGVHDPLSARVVAFDHSGRRLVLVSLDNIGFYGDADRELRKAILETCPLDPWHRVLPEFKTDNGWIPEPVLMGTWLGQEVVHVARNLENFSTAGPVRSVVRTIQLPTLAADEGKSSPESLPFTLSVGRLGDLALVGLGGEVFNEIGRAIKDASPAKMTLIVTHCNGAAGYVPTRASYPAGGYEIRTTPFAPGADDRLRAAALETLNELFAGGD